MITRDLPGIGSFLELDIEVVCLIAGARPARNENENPTEIGPPTYSESTFQTIQARSGTGPIITVRLVSSLSLETVYASSLTRLLLAQGP